MNNATIEVIDKNSEDGGILRTSTQRQQDNGDSPDIQREKIAYATNKHGLKVGVWLNVAASASGSFETQPLLQALEYFQTAPTIKRVWCSIVNRMTRGELLDFLMVQKEYSKKGIELCDTQGDLLSEKRDSLESLNVSYKFNKYDANEGKMIDAVMAARKNWRDNLTQLHSAEISYARAGYWVNGATPMGFQKKRVQTKDGKRLILIPEDNIEALWFRKIFELSLKEIPKAVIVKELNKLGYQSRARQKRDKYNKNIVIGEAGKRILTIKQLDKFLQNPIYALVRNSECQQTLGKPIKIYGTPFLTYDEFNKINQGRIKIIEDNEGVKVVKGKPLKEFRALKSDSYPFKKFVLCPICKSYLYAGATRSRSGKHIPRYHCQKKHKYWSVNQGEFDKTILEFTKNLKLKDEKIVQFKEILLNRIQEKLVTLQSTTINYQIRVTALETMSKELMTKIKAARLLSVQEELEDELEKVENEKLLAITERDTVEKEQLDIRMVINRVMYFLNHLEKGLLGLSDGLQRAAAWSTIFVEPPTYNDLVFRTAKLRSHIELISTSESTESLNVGTKGLEPLTSSV